MVTVKKFGQVIGTYTSVAKCAKDIGITPTAVVDYCASGEAYHNMTFSNTKAQPQPMVMIFHKGRLVNTVYGYKAAEQETGIKAYKVRELIREGEEKDGWSFDVEC